MTSRRRHIAGDFFLEAEAPRTACDSKAGNAYRQAVQRQPFRAPPMDTCMPARYGG